MSIEHSITDERQKIGELNEKQIHRVLKNIIEPDVSKQEVRLAGNFGIADILRENPDGRVEVFEIQTKYFYKLKNKLDYYMSKGYDVTVIYPVVVKRVLNWVDPVTDQVLESRKSRTGKGIHSLQQELYGVQQYIGKVKFQVYSLEADEYKYLDGNGQYKKNHSTKIDKIPTQIVSIDTFEDLNDYLNLIPDSLKNDQNTFTSDVYAKVCKINLKLARTELLILNHLGLVDRVGKSGRKYLYKVL